MLDFSLELLLNKLEAMEHKLQKIENEMLENRSKQEQSQKEMFTALKKFEHQIALNFSELQQRIEKKIINNQYKQPSASSCKDIPTDVSGAYMIDLKNVGFSVPFRVYCEQQAFDGGWIVIQYRYDGSLDFYRDWNEFRDGFGDLQKEFWLGLEKVHQITKGRRHELMIELKDFAGTYKYAHYLTFEIGSESEEYNLKRLGTYNGTAGNEMVMNDGRKFTTKDRDNDVYDENCAQMYQGAWWHKQCTAANLNGLYINTINKTSMHWYDFKKGRHGLSYSGMMIRELD
ncbi:angiopoietin-related protein 1-like [Anopheles aquasalis]|uniref:angiopoietin-related protein 1-like n=1 Tax=Anopheles aquasalis TaxID=42839 RepID=UPI00215A7498|nr:angiopoietin-related protein 1-like [Anopheles aquasalis]